MREIDRLTLALQSIMLEISKNHVQRDIRLREL